MKKLKNPLLLLVVVGLFFASCAGKEEKKAENTELAAIDPNYVLTYEQAKRFVNNYERHAGIVESSKGEKQPLPNTRAIWFPADRLEKLAADIRAQGGDGVRFYLATYDKFGTGKNAAIDAHLGYNTLVMVSTYPTKKYGKEIHQDYYADKPGRNGAKGFIIGNPPENRGEMCPPPKTCDSAGADLISYPKSGLKL